MDIRCFEQKYVKNRILFTVGKAKEISPKAALGAAVAEFGRAGVLGDLDDVRTYLKTAQRAATLIYAHFKKEFGVSAKK